jgi:type III pantothenate kinase
MTWLFDIGNTRLKWAAARNGRHGPVHAVAHRVATGIDATLAKLGTPSPGDIAWLASVASDEITADWTAALEGHGLEVRRVRTLPAALGVRIAYADPARLGVDRFLALLAAHARADGPWLLVSVGSALTVDLLDVDGTHHGGLIAPTPAHMRRALARRFPALADAQGEVCDWATDTGDAVQSGTLFAAVGLVERAFRQAQQHLETVPTVLVTGGDGATVREHLPFATEAVEAPVLAGLARLAGASS